MDAYELETLLCGYSSVELREFLRRPTKLYEELGWYKIYKGSAAKDEILQVVRNVLDKRSN